MRCFGNWWARGGVQRVGSVIAVVMLVGIVGAQITAAHGSVSSHAHILFKPAGEMWN